MEKNVISSKSVQSALKIRSAVSEKRIAVMRLAQSLLLPGIYWFLMDKTGTDTILALFVTVIALLFSIFAILVRPFDKVDPLLFSHLASVADTMVVFSWLFATGGKETDFHILLHISLMGIAFRTGRKFTLGAGMAYILLWGLIFYIDNGFPGEASTFALDVVFILITTGIGMIISKEFTKQTKNILAKKELTEILKKNNNFLNLLQETSEAFNFTGSITKAADNCIQTLCRELNWEIGHLYFAENENTLVSSGIWGNVQPQGKEGFMEATEKHLIAKGIGIPGKVLQKKDLVWIKDLSKISVPRSELFNGLMLKSAIAFPVFVKDEIVAVFEFFSKETLEEDPDLTNLLRQIGLNFGRVVERIRAESNLRQKNDEIHRIFSNAPDAIVIMDKTGKITNWNPRAESLFGWTAGEADGALLSQLILINGSKPAFLTMIENINKAGVEASGHSLELEARGKGNSQFFVEISISTPINVNGDQQLIAFIKDVSERRKAQETESMLASIVKNSNDSIISKNLNSIIESWNPGAEKMYGYAEKEVIGKKISIIFPPEKLDEEQEIIEKVKQGQGIEHYETIRRRKDGTNIFVSLTVSPIFDENGAIKGASSIARDITKKKETEEDLVKFRHALNNSADDIFIIDRNKMKFEDVNERACISTGYSREELLKMGPADIKPEYSEEQLAKVFDDISNSPSNFGTIQTLHQRKDGSTFDVEVLLRSFKYYDNTYLVAAVRDITERIEAEKILEETNVFLNTILENLPVMVFVKSANDLSFVSINKACEEITGISKSEIIGKTDYDFFPKEDADFFVAKDREVLENDHILEIPEEIIETRNQGKRWLYTVKVPIKDADGKARYLLGISEDITEKREAYNRIKKLNFELTKNLVQLEEVNKELESFTYSVSHDLRAPLRAINGYTQILTEDYEKNFDENGRRMLNEVQESAHKMGKLIEDLLAFSRLGRKTVNKDKVDMKNLIQEVIGELETIPKLKAKIEVKETLPVLADASLLKQVLYNLLSNAVKYSSKTPQPCIKIGSVKKENGVEYYVKDNGVGFDMGYYKKLFQVFQRLHSENEFEGTGVGLAIVSKIISRHGGKVWATAEPGKGATFYFTLPDE